MTPVAPPDVAGRSAGRSTEASPPGLHVRDSGFEERPPWRCREPGRRNWAARRRATGEAQPRYSGQVTPLPTPVELRVPRSSPGSKVPLTERGRRPALGRGPRPALGRGSTWRRQAWLAETPVPVCWLRSLAVQVARAEPPRHLN